MRFIFLYIFVILISMKCLLCIGPDWNNNHPMLQQAVEERTESFTRAFLNITFVDRITGQLMSSWVNIGKFGESHDSPATGILIHARSESSLIGKDPFTGCNFPLRPSYGVLPTNETWVALVKRGQCSFQQKMENAYKSNATGIIIYDDKDNADLEKMQLQLSVPREFSAVLTYKTKGEELAKLIDNGTKLMVRISIGEAYSKNSNINRTSVLFVSVSFIVLMVVSLGWIIFYYVQKCRYIHAKERLSKRLCSAAKKALQKIPTRYVRSDDKDGSNLGEADCCAICIELFKPADVVRLLPCRHEFHKLCIDPWLLENRTCPMCKMDILKYFGFELTGSQESMLRVDQEDPLSDIFFFEPDTHLSSVVETSTIVPITITSINGDNRPTTSNDCIGGVFTESIIIDADVEKNGVSIFGKLPQKSSLSKNYENKVSPIKRSMSLDNIPSINQS